MSQLKRFFYVRFDQAQIRYRQCNTLRICSVRGFASAQNPLEDKKPAQTYKLPAGETDDFWDLDKPQKYETEVSPKEAEERFWNPEKTDTSKNNKKKEEFVSQMRWKLHSPTKLEVTKIQYGDLELDENASKESKSTALLNLLTGLTQLPEAEIKRSAEAGGLWRLGKQIRTPYSLPLQSKGSKANFYYNKEFLDWRPVREPVLIADKGPGQYSVYYKPPGMHLKGTNYGDLNTLKYFVSKAAPKRDVRYINNLDFAIGGVIIVAHTRTSELKFQECMDAGGYKERWIAQVHGRLNPPTGKIVTKKQTATTSSRQKRRGGMRAPEVKTHYSNAIYNEAGDFSVVTLTTDERNAPVQFAEHLQSVGNPIVKSHLTRPEEFESQISESDNYTYLNLNLAEIKFWDPFFQRTRVMTMPSDPK